MSELTAIYFFRKMKFYLIYFLKPSSFLVQVLPMSKLKSQMEQKIWLIFVVKDCVQEYVQYFTMPGFCTEVNFLLVQKLYYHFHIHPKLIVILYYVL